MSSNVARPFVLLWLADQAVASGLVMSATRVSTVAISRVGDDHHRLVCSCGLVMSRLWWRGTQKGRSSPAKSWNRWPLFPPMRDPCNIQTLFLDSFHASKMLTLLPPHAIIPTVCRRRWSLIGRSPEKQVRCSRKHL